MLRFTAIFSAVACAMALASTPAQAQSGERTIKIYGFGAKSGVVRIFGIQSEAAMQAAAARSSSWRRLPSSRSSAVLRGRPRERRWAGGRDTDADMRRP